MLVADKIAEAAGEQNGADSARIDARLLEVVVSPAHGGILGLIKDAQVFTDDLLGAVSLQALCAEVPARDVPCRIEEENGVILHRIDSGPEPRLSPLDLLLRLLFRRDVAEMNVQRRR